MFQRNIDIEDVSLENVSTNDRLVDGNSDLLSRSYFWYIFAWSWTLRTMPMRFPLLLITGYFGLTIPSRISTPTMAGSFLRKTNPLRIFILPGRIRSSISALTPALLLASTHLE